MPETDRRREDQDALGEIAAALEARESQAPGAPQRDDTAISVPAGRVSVQEACRRLGVAPRTFRQLLAEFYDLVEPEPAVSEGGPPRDLSQTAVARLARVVAMRNAGSGYQDIRRALAGEASAGKSEPPVTGLAGLAGLAEGLDRLQRELSRSEERRREDRDRLLTAILRLQQEIQHLRYEVVALHSRRDRKRH